MTKLPEVKPKKLAKALKKLGFQSRSGKGSHVVFYHKDGRYTSIPIHPKPIGKGLLHKILKQIDVSSEEIKKVL
ncbi:MAG: YcfA family protein [Microgenomates group bacterium GW2011_GWC1_37_8]|uniref:YcfA family protein n=1 Tax=Candidatus Woesebacteria bacterium GW2011_GWB1_38_8 TaxID=1618570 RepID=A0A0G0LDV1_9BACT|nr:MAG: YcfA family protein [Microgenomates group bacterium GW2011_GWC1_37_8]KKQ86085.1 MAG: YcfA family protein [Candidatus Woesebacteria bacterium GW2011_GWB1_38_8]